MRKFINDAPTLLAQVLVVALAELLIATGSSWLLRVSNVTAPISLGTGTGLGLMLCWGARVAPGVLLGQMAYVNIISSASGTNSWTVLLCFSVSPMLSTLAGHALVRRWVGFPLQLLGRRDILRFVVLIGSVAPAIAATLDLLCLVAFLGFRDTAQMPRIWVDSLLSYGIGNLMAAPLVMALLARPREIWRSRMLHLAPPLTLASGLLVAGVSAVGRWDHQQRQAIFMQHAELTTGSLKSALQETSTIAITLEALLIAAPSLGQDDFERAFSHIIRGHPGVDSAAIISGLGEKAAPLLRLAAWRAGADPGLQALIEALQGMPLPKGREAVVSAARHWPAAAAGTPPRVAMVQPLAPAAATGAAQEFVVLMLDPQALVDAVMAQTREGLVACVIDIGSTPPNRLAGAAGCEKPDLVQLAVSDELKFGGRPWRLRLYTTRAAPIHAGSSAQLAAACGMLGLGLLVALLLTLAERSRRGETLLAQRAVELQRTALALQTQEQRFRSIFDEAPVGVCIVSLEGRLLDGNPGFCRLLGCALAELPARYREFAAADAELARSLNASGAASLQVQREFQHSDGRRVQTQILVSLLRDAEGVAECLLCVAEDISDRLRMEASEQAREAAEMASRAKSEFLSRMSHELRTPLNGLLGFAQLMKLDSAQFAPVHRGWIEHIDSSGWRLLGTINEVLDLSRSETGHLSVRTEALDAHRLCDEAVARHAAAAARRGIRVSASLDPLARAVMADGVRVGEILDKLLANAIRHTPDDGQLRLSARPVAPAFVDISVTDHGPGLEAGQLDALFMPFPRPGQRLIDVAEGTGVGLLVARRLAELMGGGLRASSAPGHGCTFTLRLPAEPAQPAAHDTASAAAAHLPQDRHRLVYIEDNPVNVEVMRAVIALRPEFTLDVFEDGASGLASLRAQPPDLVLLDMHLPDTDGLSLLKALRAAPGCAALPVVLVSAETIDAAIAEALREGRAEHLPKPFAVPALFAMLDRLLAP